jgi:hypothetical protein
MIYSAQSWCKHGGALYGENYRGRYLLKTGMGLDTFDAANSRKMVDVDEAEDPTRFRHFSSATSDDDM